MRQKREGAPHLTLGKRDGAAAASEGGWRGRERGFRWHPRSLAERAGSVVGLRKDGDLRDLNKAVAGQPWGTSRSEPIKPRGGKQGEASKAASSRRCVGMLGRGAGRETS